MKQLALVLAAVLVGAGCASTGSRSGGAPQEIHLYGVPVTLDIDGKPGSDGFAVRLYASRADRARGLAIRSGAIEILLFDGVVRGQLADQQPLKTWSFTPRELPAQEMETSLGSGYRFVLSWGDKKPTRDHITVVARYVPKSGPPVYSSPSVIAAVLK